jgi:hypothetical protein
MSYADPIISLGAHVPNLASRVLSRLERRVSADWQARFGHPLWLLDTFVDPRFFRRTCYRAANWLPVAESRGFRRTRAGYDMPSGPIRLRSRRLKSAARAGVSTSATTRPPPSSRRHRSQNRNRFASRSRSHL